MSEEFKLTTEEKAVIQKLRDQRATSQATAVQVESDEVRVNRILGQPGNQISADDSIFLRAQISGSLDEYYRENTFKQ